MKLFLSSTVFLIAITAFTPFASGQTLYWAGGTNASASVGTSPPTTDNNFNTPGNWSTVPPNLFFGNSGPQTVPGPSNIAIVDADVNNGTITDGFIFTGAPITPVVINQTTQGNTVQGLIISNTEFSGGTVTINNTSGQPLTVAGTHASSGDLLVDGGVTLNYGGGTLKVTNGLIAIGDNATAFSFFNSSNIGGSGTFNINSGTFTFDTTAGKSTQMIVGYSQDSPSGNFFGTATGTVVQGSLTANTSSTVQTGGSLIIGFNGGVGNWTVTNGSLLETGTQAPSYLIALGSNGGPGGFNGGGSSGTLTIGKTTADTGTFNLGSSGSNTPTDLQLGTLDATSTVTTGGSGTIVQNGGSVNFAGKHTTVEVGDLGGGTGAYNLNGGTLNIGTFGSTSATDAVTFTLGATAGSTGTLTQSAGSILNVASGTTFNVGLAGAGIGTYTMNGGTANFNAALTLGTTGTLNLNGGILNISTANLLGAGAGTINFGGGTLKFLNSAGPYIYNFGGSLVSDTSTIDASSTSLTTFKFGQALNGAGGITLIGNGTTAFSFASVAGNGAPANTYSGPTTILGGTLNAFAADFANAGTLSPLTIGAAGSPATLNLSLGTSSATLAEAIAGNGTLNVNFGAAGETLTLSNTSSSLSTVNIVLAANTGVGPNDLGTLQLFSGSFGTISEVAAGNNVIIGTNTGTGAVTIGSGTYTGTTTIFQNFSLNATSLTSAITNAGTLNVTGAPGITGAITSNSGLLNTTKIVGNVTSNSGILNVTGAAGIVGSVVSNTGMLSTTVVTGSVANSGIFVASSSTNTVGGNLTNTGTVMATSTLPGVVNTPTFTIGGALSLDPGGTLIVRTNGKVADQYAATGVANLDGVIQVQVTGGGKIGTTTYSIVTGSSVTAGAGLTLGPNTALFSYALANTGTAEDLLVTQAPIATYALTANQRAVAGALDGSNSPLFSFFGNVSLAAGPTTIPAALDALSPESLQYSRMIAFENSTFLVERTNSWLSDLRSGYSGLDTSAFSIANPGFETGLGRSLGSLLASTSPAFHQSAPNGVNYYPDGGSDSTSLSPHSSESTPTAAPAWDSSTQVISDSPNPYLTRQNPSGPEAPAMSEFIGGDVVLADLNRDQGALNAPSSKASYTAGDVTGGVSFRMNSHLAAGVLFDYNHTDAKTDSSGSKTKVDTYSPGLFATYFDHGFYVNGLFSFGYNNYSNTRNISFLGDTASSSPSGQQYVTDLDFGYDFHPDKQWIVGPTLGVTYTHLDIDSFTETGAPGADLAVDSQSADSLRSRFGGHAIFQTNTGDVLLQPNITIMWQHEYLDNGSGITSSFSDFNSNPFTIQTAAPSRDSALIGCGLTATLSNSMTLYLDYLADVGASDYFAQSVVGGLKARF